MDFRQLVKLIHPDTSTGITSAGEKMVLAKKYRNDPVKLQKLAVMWGVLPKVYNIKDSVIVTLNNGHVYGVIVDIVKTPFPPAHNIVIFNLKTQSILIVYHSDMSKSHSNIRVIGQANMELWTAVNVAYDLYKQFGHKKPTDRGTTRPKTIFEYVDITPNTQYNDGTEVYLQIAAAQGWFEVTRTTARRVYFWKINENRETYTNIGNVRRARKRNDS